MKLHLSKGLRMALLASICASAALAGQTMAADLSSDDLTALPTTLDNGRYWIYGNDGPYDMSTGDGNAYFLSNDRGSTHQLHVAGGDAIGIQLGAWNDGARGTLKKLGDGTLVVTGLAECNGYHGPRNIDVNSGKLELQYGSTINGATLSSGTELVLSGAATTVVNGDIANSGKITVNSGATLALGGTYNLTQEQFDEKTTLIDEYTHGGTNGFHVIATGTLSATDYTGTVEGEGSVVFHNSASVTKAGAGAAIVQEDGSFKYMDSKTFYVNSGTVTLRGSWDGASTAEERQVLSQVEKFSVTNATLKLGWWTDCNADVLLNNGTLDLQGSIAKDGSHMFELAGGDNVINAKECNVFADISGEGNLSLKSTGTFNLQSTINHTGALSFDSGTFTLYDDSASIGANVTGVTIKDGAKLNVRSDNNGGNGFAKTEVTVEGGAELKLSGGDALGYTSNGATPTPTIILDGSEGKTATLLVEKHQTLTTNIELKGDSEIKTEGTEGDFHAFGGSITAEGERNVISTKLMVRKQLDVEVTNEADVLTINGEVTLANQEDKNSDKLLKTGAGTLKLGSAAVVQNSVALDIDGGTLDLTDVTELSAKSLDFASGTTLKLDGQVTMTGSLTLNQGTTVDVTGFSGSNTRAAGPTTALAQAGTLSVDGQVAVTGLEDGVAAALTAENNVLTLTTLTDLDITGIAGCEDGVLTFTTNLDVSNLSGDVTFELEDGKTWGSFGSEVLAAVGSWDAMLQLSFQNTAGEAIYLAGVTSLTLNNYSGENFAVSADGLKVGTYAAYMIPEPATATLSLLALAGLAARRRRK